VSGLAVVGASALSLSSEVPIEEAKDVDADCVSLGVMVAESVADWVSTVVMVLEAVADLVSAGVTVDEEEADADADCVSTGVMVAESVADWVSTVVMVLEADLVSAGVTVDEEEADCVSTGVTVYVDDGVGGAGTVAATVLRSNSSSEQETKILFILYNKVQKL